MSRSSLGPSLFRPPRRVLRVGPAAGHRPPAGQLFDPAMLDGPRIHASSDLVVLERFVFKVHGLDKTACHLFYDAFFSREDVNDDELHVRAVSRIDVEPFSYSKVPGAGRPDAVPSEDAGTEDHVLQGQQGVGAIPDRAGAGRQPGLISPAG